MLVCPVCGFRNPDANSRCLKCSAFLKRDISLLNDALSESAPKARALRLKLLWQGPLETLQRLGERLAGPLPEGVPYRFPFTAGLLSILPGGGQLYNSQIYKAAVAFLTGAFLLALCFATLREPFSNALLLFSLLMWVGIWNDAVSTAIRINGQSWPLRNSLALLFGAMFLIGTTLTFLQFFGLSAVTLVKVRQDVHQPVIRTGDRILVNHMAYLLGSPRAGEIIYYDPPRFTAEDNKANTYSINIKAYFQRVIGEPGDRIVKRGSEITRNGQALPFSAYPFGADVLPDFDLVVPPDCYFLPVTYIPQDLLAGTMGVALGGRTITHIFEGGLVFKGWEQSCLITSGEIFGRAVAIVNPPAHRNAL